MDPFNKDRNRRRKNPFDFINDDEFEKIFDEMQRMFENIDFREMIEDMLRNGFDPDKRFIRGFSLNIGSDGKPKLQEFGNRSVKSPDGEPILSDEREPLTDVIEGDEHVSVTVEIPGVEKEDIDLKITEKKLEIKVNNPKRKYHKIVDIPCKIKPNTTKATYKNGVLDIILKTIGRKIMNRITINGQTMEVEGNNVSIIKGKIIIDGKEISFSDEDVMIKTALKQAVEIKWCGCLPLI